MDVQITQVECFHEDFTSDIEDEGERQTDSDSVISEEQFSDNKKEPKQIKPNTVDNETSQKRSKKGKKVEALGKVGDYKEDKEVTNIHIFTTENKYQSSGDHKDRNSWTCIDEESLEKKKSKSTSQFGKSIRNAASYMKKKLTTKKKKNCVKEISLKPEENRTECWTSSGATQQGSESSAGDSSRSNSAGSNEINKERLQSIPVEEADEDDGIEVIYDVEYNGGGA